MVERLKSAIEKARVSRARAIETRPAAAAPSAGAPETGWSSLPEVSIRPERLQRERVVAFGKSDRSHVVFDVLRTRLLKVCRTNGLRRIGITAPTKGCGKSTVALNLAFSLARQAAPRTLLVDLDLRKPHVAPRLGVREPHPLPSFLAGQAPLEACFRRVGDALALGLNTETAADSAELIQSDSAARALAGAQEALAPGLTLYDLPPVFVSDDVLAALGLLDGVLLVAAAGRTRSREIEESERLLADNTTFLGVVLNKCEEQQADVYAEGYA